MKCTTPHCRKEAKRGKVCHKCAKKKYRSKYPLKACYQNLRSNSKRRGKQFTITYEEFLLVIDGTGYVDNHGRFAHNLSIDRKKNDIGYTYENASVKTVSLNSIKGTHDWPDDPPF